LGGHVSRMADFIEQMTLMIGFTENLAGAWQLVRKTGMNYFFYLNLFK
jgi:hypothetical protein